jgi:hypothetical protein
MRNVGIGEISDCLNQCFRKGLFCLHAQNLTEIRVVSNILLPLHRLVRWLLAMADAQHLTISPADVCLGDSPSGEPRQ